jgi:antitoxin ParD1/3/4
MNVNLTPELERLVQEKVASGLYNNQSEVVREALRLLSEQDRFRELQLVRLRSALAEGLAQTERGDLFDGETVVEEMRGLLRSRLGSKKNAR